MTPGNRTIGKQEVAGVLGYHVKIVAAHKLLQPYLLTAISHQIKTRGRLPQYSELRVINEYIQSARRIRSIFKIVVATIQ
jgi:hypothetical protein